MLENSTHRLRAIEPSDVDLIHDWENDSSTWWLGSTITPFSKEVLMRFATGDHDLFRDKQLRLILDEKLKNEKWEVVGAVEHEDC